MDFFAGTWTRWTAVRNVHIRIPDNRAKQGSWGHPPKATPFTLTMREEIDIWMTAPPGEALTL
jgi:hypothetical protein